jgi:hypothetical protein
MNTYTIDPSAGRKIRAARLAQVKAARDLFNREATLTDTPWAKRNLKRNYANQVRSDYARLQFVNGTTIETALPVRILAGWLGSVDAGKVSVSFGLGVVTLESGTSRLNLWMPKAIRGPGQGYAARTHTLPVDHFSALGAAIRLEAPVDGGEFVVTPNAGGAL